MLKSKKAVELPFSWLFAMVAGAFIIFLAVYAVTKMVGTEQAVSGSAAAKDIANLLNPIGNGISGASPTHLDFPKETRIYLNCEKPGPRSLNPAFGRQIISFSEKSGFLKDWTSPGANISRYNRYIFSDDVEQGKKFYIYSKPFYLGFRVDDLIMMSPKIYCFVAPPQNIQEELALLNLENINYTQDMKACKKGSVSVCFGNDYSGDCNITVSGECTDYSEGACRTEYDYGTVKKNGYSVSYFGNLLYAAIFSSQKNYECNIARLSAKAQPLAQVYKDKIDILKTKGCSSNTEQYIQQIVEDSIKSDNSAKFLQLYSEIKEMNKIACHEKFCQLYSPEYCSS